jgi:hypothetical protein
MAVNPSIRRDALSGLIDFTETSGGNLKVSEHWSQRNNRDMINFGKNVPRSDAGEKSAGEACYDRDGATVKWSALCL